MGTSMDLVQYKDLSTDLAVNKVTPLLVNAVYIARQRENGMPASPVV